MHTTSSSTWWVWQSLAGNSTQQHCSCTPQDACAGQILLHAISTGPFKQRHVLKQQLAFMVHPVDDLSAPTN